MCGLLVITSLSIIPNFLFFSELDVVDHWSSMCWQREVSGREVEIKEEEEEEEEDT